MEELIEQAIDLTLSTDWKEDLLVESMVDGGMGSLKLIPSEATPHRKFGGVVSDLEFNDADGAKVFVDLNVDQNGLLFEVDVWTTDFSALIRIPEDFD